jgi:hypothetical protein
VARSSISAAASTASSDIAMPPGPA